MPMQLYNSSWPIDCMGVFANFRMVVRISPLCWRSNTSRSALEYHLRFNSSGDARSMVVMVLVSEKRTERVALVLAGGVGVGVGVADIRLLLLRRRRCFCLRGKSTIKSVEFEEGIIIMVAAP